MITKTASEIMRQAKFLAQCENSDFLDFFVQTNIINEVYEEVYQDIVTHTKYYLCSVPFENHSYLPCDCYQIFSITDRWNNVIEKAPEGQRVDGCYSIGPENKIHIYSGGDEEYTLNYFPVPVSVTAPADRERLELIPGDIKILSVDDEGIYYTSTDTMYFYDFANKTSAESAAVIVETAGTLNNKPVVVTKDPIVTSIKVGGEEILGSLGFEEGQVQQVFADKNIMFIETLEESGSCIYMYQEESGLCPFTHNMHLLGFSCNDDGLGLVVSRNDVYYNMSYVPDTILDFPNNIFYTVMEERIALLLASIVGVDNQYLSGDYKDRIEEQYYKTLVNDDISPTRVRNVLRRH